MKNQIGIYILGDSICYGQLISLHSTWATALAQKVSSYKNLKKEIIVQNCGINGNTTRQALERLHYDITSHSPNIVLVQFGMNDCNFWNTDNGHPRVSKDCFKYNLIEIISKIESCGADYFVLNTNHLSNKGKIYNGKIDYDQSNREYNELVREAYLELIKKGTEITLCDIEKDWEIKMQKNPSINLKEFLLEDGIHLSSKGHKLYENKVIPIVLELISKYVNKYI